MITKLYLVQLVDVEQFEFILISLDSLTNLKNENYSSYTYI